MCGPMVEMPKKKNKPVTTSEKAPFRKQKSHKIIGKLHEINKKKVQLRNARVSEDEKEKMKTVIEKWETEIGGLATYQMLSKSAEKHYGNFNSAKWVWKELQDLNLLSKDKLNLLDVGALDLNYKKYSSEINATYIDLNPQVPGIFKDDFLEFKSAESDVYDIVVLSLVINFVGDPGTRGQMLLKAHRLLKLQGHLVIVLPLACVDNSRYLTSDLFSSMLSALGFSIIKVHNTRKLVFFLSQKTLAALPSSSNRKFPKKLLRSGGGMNNFCIVLS